jgi:hypothetical protein
VESRWPTASVLAFAPKRRAAEGRHHPAAPAAVHTGYDPQGLIPCRRPLITSITMASTVGYSQPGARDVPRGEEEFVGGGQPFRPEKGLMLMMGADDRAAG